MTATEDQIIAAITSAKPSGKRLMVAIAAPPGAGKSTLATSLAARLGGAAVVPMDGFHLDNAILDARGLRPRKGAPETYDAVGFASLIARLKAEDEVVIPVFDRNRDLAIAGAEVIGPDHHIALIEGNYLLLGEEPWARLAPLWDMTIWIDVPMAELERRLIQRWLDHGMGADAARVRALGNDIPNARRVCANPPDADFILHQG